MKSLLLAVLLVAWIGAAAAKDETDLPPIEPYQFAEFKQQLVEKLPTTQRYSEMTRDERNRLLAALDRMEATLSEVDSIDEIPMPQRVELFNDQELVNMLLSRAREDSRLVCQREYPIGSNIARTQCQTVRDREAMARDARESMRKRQRCFGQGVSTDCVAPDLANEGL